MEREIEIKALGAEMEKMTPKFHLSEEVLKAIKGWETGKKYTIEMIVKQIGKHEDEGKPVEARFEILSAKEKAKEESVEEGKDVLYVSETI